MGKGDWVTIMADQIAARWIRASRAGLPARIVQHRQGTGSDVCARYRLHRLVLLLLALQLHV